jgi:hypothetical protein
MQFIRKLEPFLNVAASQRAVLNSKLLLGNVLERIYLVLGGGAFTKAQLSQIRARLNGKTTMEATGTNLDLIQRYLLLNNTAGIITLDWTEPVSRSVQGQLMGALNTAAAGVTDFTLEVDIGAATTPTLEAYAQLRSPESMAIGFDPALAATMRGLVQTTLPVTGAGEFTFDLNYGAKGQALIKRLFIFSTVLTSLRIKADSLDIFEGVSAALNTYAQLDYGRVAQTGMYVFDPLVDGNQSDAVPTRRADGTPRNFQFLFTASGAGTITVYADLYAQLHAL